MKKNLFVVAALGLALAGCGDDVTKTTVVNETTGISQLAKGAEFPDCDSSSVGEMLYAADSGALYICDESGWRTLNGKDGESSVDTVVLKDTLLQKDTLIQKDSVFFSQIDTVVLKDTLVFKDTLILSNVDTLIIRDTLVGLNGESCSAEILEDGTGYKIVCGADSVGVVLNGIGCTVADSGNGVVTVQCAADTVKLYKALCGTTPYDPDSGFFCQNGVLHFTDSRDGQAYRVTTIGTQTWMAENLNYRYTLGTADLDSSSFCYDNDTANCTKYGRLYLWSAAIDSAALANDSENPLTCGYGVTCTATESVRGVCPDGWHLPTDDEWLVLLNAVGGIGGAGTKLKATNGWYRNGNGTDDYGFSVLPAGFRVEVDAFDGEGEWAYLWSTTQTDDDHAQAALLSYGDGGVALIRERKLYAYSVRCLSD